MKKRKPIGSTIALRISLPKKYSTHPARRMISEERMVKYSVASQPSRSWKSPSIKTRSPRGSGLMGRDFRSGQRCQRK